MDNPIKVIGIGEDGRNTILPIYEKWIYESELLVGGERQLSCFSDYQGETITIKGGLRELALALEEEKRNTVILASGDPLFYGIGGYLSSKVKLEIYPFFSSVQLAFARMKESWQDAYFASVHGRSMKGLIQRMDGRGKVALLTDEENNPSKIARYLLSHGAEEYRAFVAENLGSAGERTGWYSLEEMAAADFSSLNIVILKKTGSSPEWPIGIPDEEFLQRRPDKGLITKKEIRTLSLSELKLKENSVVWDIGTCTGSIAIEAAKIARDGAVFAIEKNEQDLENCHQNMKRFRTDFTAVCGKAPEGLEGFPDPDAVFIGGTAGGMEEILDACCSRLRPDGRIVLNAATIESLAGAVKAFKDRGYDASVTLAQISRSKPIRQLTRFEALNPVYIISAKRKEEA